MYSRIPAENPGAVGETDHEGADVLKVSVSEALGLDIDYYALVDLDGFAEMVDALGGITVNINTHVPVGGNTDRGIYPDRWLEPGENVHLKGWDACGSPAAATAGTTSSGWAASAASSTR